MTRVLVTGGAGYIGSHTLLELLAQGRDVMVLDDYSNASPEVLNRVRARRDIMQMYHPMSEAHS